MSCLPSVHWGSRDVCSTRVANRMNRLVANLAFYSWWCAMFGIGVSEKVSEWDDMYLICIWFALKVGGGRMRRILLWLVFGSRWFSQKKRHACVCSIRAASTWFLSDVLLLLFFHSECVVCGNAMSCFVFLSHFGRCVRVCVCFVYVFVLFVMPFFCFIFWWGV